MALKEIKKETNNSKSAIDRLIDAQNGILDEEEGMKEEYKKHGFIDSIPSVLKALFIKYWFVGAACFFFLWGLGNYISANIDKILIFGLATGALTDLLTNNFLRLLEKEKDEYEFYSMFYQRKIWFFFANILYGLFITFLVVYTYEGINSLIIKLNPTKYSVDDVPIGVEPLLYSLFYLVYDMIFIMLKNLIKKLFKKIKSQEV